MSAMGGKQTLVAVHEHAAVEHRDEDRAQDDGSDYNHASASFGQAENRSDKEVPDRLDKYDEDSQKGEISGQAAEFQHAEVGEQNDEQPYTQKRAGSARECLLRCRSNSHEPTLR